MAIVKFFLKDFKAKSKTSIQVNFSYDGRRLRCSAGISIEPQFWIFKNSKGSIINYVNHRGYTGYNKVNNHLTRVKKLIEDFYLSYKERGIIPEPDSIKRHLLENINQPEFKKEKDGFYDVFDKFLQVQRDLKADRSIQNYNTILNSIKEFEKTTGYQITFKNIDLNFYEQYQIFLFSKENPRYKDQKLVKKDDSRETYIIVDKTDPRPGTTVGLFNDTVAKNISTLKTFLSWAYERNFTSNNEYIKFKTFRKAKNEIVTLRENELVQLHNFDLSKNPRLEKVRDLFLFALFTSQRWGDISAFNKNDVQGTVWRFIAGKTKKETIVPLVGFSSPALTILKKYDFELPKISGQKFNDYLKEVGQLIPLDEPVMIKRYIGKKEIEIQKPKWAFMSSHMARRSAVTILLEKGVPPTTIMKLTNHQNLATLLKYESTSNEALKRGLETVGNLV